MMKVLRTTAAVLGVSIGLLASAATVGVPYAAAGSNLYWADDISLCEERCPSLTFPDCACVKLPPIVIGG